MALDKKKQQEIKAALGAKAAELVLDGMLVGLGSGSTAHCFIEYLAKRCRQGLKIKAVSSSLLSMDLAQKLGIEVVDMDLITSIDLTVDGADEVDSQKRLIKGGGGAHVREKILAHASKQMVIIVDETKLVGCLGKCGLPVEILPFGHTATIAHLNALGYRGVLRKTQEGNLYITDNDNYLYDIRSPPLFPEPEKSHDQILKIPGVLDTGFFFNLASNVLVGYATGNIEVM